MSDKLAQFITEGQKSAIRAPISEARTLPRLAFTADEFFQLEIERIFSKQWTAIGFVQQTPEPGCLLPIEFGGIPLLIVHSDDGKIRVFHNIVPYDGCLAVIEACEDQTGITTPYHGWRYNLCGKLLETPYWDGTITSNRCALNGHSGDLIEIRSEIELGVIFIDMSGKAEDFHTHKLPLSKLLADYRIHELDIGRDENQVPLLDNEDLATNWKTHYENWAINVLHEAFTHEIYAESAQIPRMNAAGEKTYVEHIDGHFMALSYREQDFADTYELEELPFTAIGIDPENLPERAFIGSYFPNLHLAVFPYFIHIIIAIPVNAGRTKTLRAQFYDAATATNPDLVADRLAIMADFILAGEEDGRITQAVQSARRSPVFEQQFYSPYWDNMHYTFSNMVLNALELS